MRKLLVANRGEIARRVMRTAREMGIATVAVHSDPDAGAASVREADEAVALGGAMPAESYLRADAVIAAARATGADAIHPGYGFLAENAEFAQAVIDAGLTWVGPSPAAIAAMGSKLAARERMAAAGVPVLPGERLDDDDGAGLAAAGERIGFPLLAKASAGGGGKGMRVVVHAEDLEAAVASARREAVGAFGDGTIFLERQLLAARHVEIQIFGDAHGNVVSLFERDCSVQRRHQKVIEESPSPAVDAALRERMGAAAVAGGRELGYEGAGTVEFLLAPDGEFFFLEVNTRLQVEHPVTELVTGLDLVRLQLLVAQGEPLPPEALTPTLGGHAIEARLYAEDPERAFLPVAGEIVRLRIGEDSGVRVDSGVRDGDELSVHYDPLLAKVIAHASTREEAARVLARALARAEIHGLTTNRALLVRVLEHPEFLAGGADTSFLRRHDPAALGAPALDAEQERAHAAAAALAAQAERRAGAAVQGALPSGWRNVPSQLQQVAYVGRHGEHTVGYRFGRVGLERLEVDGEPLAAPRLHTADADAVELSLGGVRRRYRVHRDGVRVWVNSDAGQADLRESPRFAAAGETAAAGSLVSPMPGLIVRVDAEPGARVERGTPLIVIEAMKMEHAVTAPAAGVVGAVLVRAGQQVEAGAVLAVIDESA